MEESFDPIFPIDALMPVMASATHFIQRTNQTPTEMGACSVLAACALVCQGLFDVRWRENKKSPLSLFIIVDAPTGERKSAVDDISFLQILIFNTEQMSLAIEFEKKYQADIALWKQKVKEIRKLISKLSARNQCTDDDERRLEQLISNEPKNRKFARILVVESTGPGLAQHLDSVYPYAGLVTDEGTTIFSSGVLRDFGMHNKLWEAGVWTSDRVTRKRIVLNDCRLGMYIQSQPDVTDDYLDNRGKLFHATGFSSRILYTKPKSTQGKRLEEFIDVRKEIIDPYNARLKELLNQYIGPTIPKQKELTLSHPASELLLWYSREVEKELREDGRFFNMRGAASKSTENTARIAAIIHTMENNHGPISVDVIRNAIKIAAWFLNQFRLRFCPRSQLELDMIVLEDFITDKIAPRFHKDRLVPGPYLCRYAPRHLRPVDRLWQVLKALELRNKVKVMGSKGYGGWHVHLTSWLPPLPVATQSRSDYQANSAQTAYWSDKIYLPVESKPEVPNNDYTLWPGVFLK